MSAYLEDEEFEEELEEAFLKNIRKMHLSDDFTDVTLVVEGQEIKAHKNILASRNEYMHSILTNDMLESKKNVIEIPDFDIATFKVFLEYLYTGIVKNDDITLELLAMADKFLDQSLKDKCDNFFCRNINFDNAIELLLFANTHSYPNMEMRALTYIGDRIIEFAKLPEFEEVLARTDVIKSILRQSKALITDDLRDDTNTFLFCFNVQPIMNNVTPSYTKSIKILIKNILWKVHAARVVGNDKKEYVAVMLSTGADQRRQGSVDVTIKLLSKKEKHKVVKHPYDFNTNAHTKKAYTIIPCTDIFEAENKRLYCPGNIITVEITFDFTKIVQ